VIYDESDLTPDDEDTCNACGEHTEDLYLDTPPAGIIGSRRRVQYCRDCWTDRFGEDPEAVLDRAVQQQAADPRSETGGGHA